jgi:hypothetical protein
MDAAAGVTSDTLTVVTLNLWHDSHEWPRAPERDRRGDAAHPARRAVPPGVLQNPELPNQAQTLGDSLGCHVLFASVDGPERPKRYGKRGA